MKFLRLLILLALAFFLAARLAPAQTAAWRTAVFSPLAPALRGARAVGDWFGDLRDFRKNARELRELRADVSRRESAPAQNEEIRLENERLAKLLEIRKTLPSAVTKSTAARVIARSPSVWNRTFFIDKGSAHGLRTDLAVLSGASLVGKTTETGPGASKVALITDPLFRIGAIVQRTRDQGVLYGTPSGECRIKYLPLDSEAREGDLVETAGSSSNFPKAVPIGLIDRIWKEPGQVYRVARVKPAADLSRIEEVLCVE